jgi:hypothetical protein
VDGSYGSFVKDLVLNPRQEKMVGEIAFHALAVDGFKVSLCHDSGSQWFGCGIVEFVCEVGPAHKHDREPCS